MIWQQTEKECAPGRTLCFTTACCVVSKPWAGVEVDLICSMHLSWWGCMSTWLNLWFLMFYWMIVVAVISGEKLKQQFLTFFYPIYITDVLCYLDVLYKMYKMCYVHFSFELEMSKYCTTDLITWSLHRLVKAHFKLFMHNLINIHERNHCFQTMFMIMREGRSVNNFTFI